MSLLSLLPAPKGNYESEGPQSRSSTGSTRQKATRDIPPYGARRGYVPTSVEDFGDGGAFPEIATLQYPLNMGRPGGSRALVSRQGNTTSLQVDAQGNTKYDAVIKQGIRKGQTVFSSPTDLIERDFEETDLRRPSQKKVEETTEATRLALEKLVEGKIASARPRQLPSNSSKKEPVYFRYTPGQQGAAYNSGAESRVIRLHEMPTDPLEPPKYRHKKVAGGPPSPPVPVMQSPPRKVTVKDQKFWKIPPCVSNWKNIKGYTIPLDKRLASDGRHLQEKTISPAFARLAEALVVAERTARSEVDERMRLKQRLGRQKKEQREREVAEKALQARQKALKSNAAVRETEKMGDVESKAQAEARMTRDQIREERKRERQREVRMSERDKKRRKNVQDRNRDRDVGEKIALGQQVQQKEATYDQRLFNQDQGMDSGFRGEDAYDVYSKPLFQGSSAAQVYRPKKVDSDVYGDDGGNEGADLLDKSSSKFRADREFEGVSDARRSTTGPRNEPVQFEKDTSNADDEFGLGGLAEQHEKDSRRDSDRRRDRDERSRRSRHQSRERSQAREELRRRRRGDREAERRRDFSRSRSRSPKRSRR